MYGVHNQQLGLKLLHLAQRLPQVGFRGEIKSMGDGVDSLSAQLDLRRGFLARDVEDVLPRAGELRRDVQ
ncbi:hypothetical protein D3C81_2239660 [compost metagenome]